MDGRNRAHRGIRRWFDAALEAVDPRQAVRGAIACDGRGLSAGGRDVPLSLDSRVIVVAVGKAASAMASGARDVLGSRIERGIILTKYGHAQMPVDGFDAYEANHPTPDRAGQDATSTIVECVTGLSPTDLVIALISGGGSALLELPRDGVSLGDMQEVTSRLMRAGAGIHDLNTVRKALSQVKGGGLRERIGPARCVTLLLSDVLGNDPSVIASGPTVPSRTGPADALDVVRRFGVEGDLPSSVLHVLRSPAGSSARIDTARDIVDVIADNAAFIGAVAANAEQDGLRVKVDETPYDGDAAQLGQDLAMRVVTLDPGIDALIRGGEAVVTVSGNGIGGRNTEMALSAAIALEGNDEWVVASLASDGDDGNSGAAGAIVDGNTAARIRAAGIDPHDALRRNDSASALRAAGGLVETGPTGTNVNDLYLAVRRWRGDGEGKR